MTDLKKRESAMDWWYSMDLEDKFYQVIPWLKGKGMNVADKHPYSLTDSEIEELHDIYNNLN